MFNPDFRLLALKFGLVKEKTEEPEHIDEPVTEVPDIKITNTLQEKDLIKEEVTAPIDLDEQGNEAKINILFEHDELEPEPEPKPWLKPLYRTMRF